MFMFVVRRHVAEFHEVSVADSKGEHVDRVLSQSTRRRPRVSAVGVAVRDEEYHLLGVRASSPQHFLPTDTETVQHVTRTVQRDWLASCCARNCDKLASNFSFKFLLQVSCTSFRYNKFLERA